MYADPEPYRPRLFAVAYRMLGHVQDAEDLVQEALLRWHRADTDEIVEPEAWLVSVVTRLAIDRLRRRATERAAYPGPWLPQPAPAADLNEPPDRRAELASELSVAFLVLLERLAPEERAAFLMRDVFDRGYPEIARMLDRSQPAVRQMVRRARARVRSSPSRFPASREAVEQLMGRFLAALREDDEQELLAVFATEATFTSDGGGKVVAARRTIRGSDRIVRLLRGIGRKYDRPFGYHVSELNGEPALVTTLNGAAVAATFIAVRDGRIDAMYRVVNPDKLRHVV